MRRVLWGSAAAALIAGQAFAGGVERSTQSVGILFEQGTYAEISFGYFEPSVSGVTGVAVGPFPAGAPSGDMSPDYASLTFGYKQALNDKVDLAVILDQPIGADVDYPGTFGASTYPLAGTTAELKSLALTALLRYKLERGFSVYGGLRAQSVSGTVSIPFVGAPGPGYTLDTNTDYRLGYVVGVAWERPDIAARVALTYNSAITHTLDYVETGPVPGTGTFDTEVPQSINLEFQSGIAADTLLFGSIRWVDWSEFTIDPAGYNTAIGSPLVSYQSDRITYNVGVGRRFNETWSGAVTFGYEDSNGDVTGNLGPTDGFTSIGLAATYTQGNMKVTGGIRYVDIGGATTTLGAQFEDNSGIGVGVRVGYTF